MAYKLELPSTEITPYILVDEEKGYMHFKGDCYSENVIVFFRNVTNWLTDFLQTDFKILTFDCELDYFNSSTSKLLYNILMDLDESASTGKCIVVNWLMNEENEMVLENAENYMEEMENLKFNMILK